MGPPTGTGTRYSRVGRYSRASSAGGVPTRTRDSRPDYRESPPPPEWFLIHPYHLQILIIWGRGWMMEEPGGTVKRLEDLAKEGDSPVDWFPTPGVGGRRRGDSLDRAPRAPGGPTAPTI
ncbi:hypothetical protein SUGI_1373260 [Cryptomeria japonica]|uniref:Uncharacterized protein n=1 Tax=Cryptomeria japonica TaxID=3369 RepID=A0AAD3NQ81_CRYJA|nr:hypothetical protein SUGI_1373260 [Cryptomeria japonica]